MYSNTPKGYVPAYLVTDSELVESLGRINLGKRDALDVLGITPRARGARHHSACQGQHPITQRADHKLFTVRPEGARDAAGLCRLVPLRVDRNLRLA